MPDVYKRQPLPRHIPSPYKMEDMIQAHLDVYQELTPYS